MARKKPLTKARIARQKALTKLAVSAGGKPRKSKVGLQRTAALKRLARQTTGF